MPYVKVVTIKLPKNPDHDPHNKVTDMCPVSNMCTDATGEHHSYVESPNVLDEDIRKMHKHVTRIEMVWYANQPL